MILQLFRRSPSHDTIASLYGTIVAQARAPVFYQIYGVPDTVNGRFEMIVIHAVLLLSRLNAEGEAVRAIGQAVFDLFCRDMDANLREMGVGDTVVPRTMRRIGEAFYGRQAVYESALGMTGGDLAAAIGRNVFDSTEPSAGALRLAAYCREVAGSLAAQDGIAISRGEVDFPPPSE